MPRLPVPGGDQGSWGQILNDYLAAAHNGDGSLKNGIVSEAKLDAAAQSKLNNVGTVPNGSITTLKLDDEAVTNAKIEDDTIAELKLAPAVRSKLNAVAPVTSVAGKTGAVSLVKADVGLGNVDNTSDINKPVSNDTQTALNGKANTVHAHAISDVTNLQTSLNAKANTADLAAVATSGDYSDLSGAPAIPAQFNPTAGTNVTLTGTYPNITFNATPGAGVTDLSTSTTGTDVTIISSSGDDAVIAAASASIAGVMTAADKTKLDGVASGAEANVNADWSAVSGDAQILNKPTLGTAASANSGDFATSAQGALADTALQAADVANFETTTQLNARDTANRNRANHTGTQAISTVTSLQSTLDAKADETVTVTGATSLTGGGDLTANRTISLVNDNANPGNSQYYGTNGAGTKGYYGLPTATDATAGAKGVVQLAGDLGGTAAAPTVPGLAAKANKLVSINAQVSTTYTLVLGDADKLVTLTNASPITLTVPDNATVAYPVGTRVMMAQMGAGQVTIVAAGGVSVFGDPGLKVAAQYGAVELFKTATDTWLLVGRLAA